MYFINRYLSAGCVQSKDSLFKLSITTFLDPGLFCRVILVPRCFEWHRGGLDADRMMTGRDTGGDV
jgi:hypothetical protein